MRVNYFKFVLDCKSGIFTLNLLSESSIETEEEGGWCEKKWIAYNQFLTLFQYDKFLIHQSIWKPTRASDLKFLQDASHNSVILCK